MALLFAACTHAHMRPARASRLSMTHPTPKRQGEGIVRHAIWCSLADCNGSNAEKPVELECVASTVSPWIDCMSL